MPADPHAAAHLALRQAGNDADKRALAAELFASADALSVEVKP